MWMPHSWNVNAYVSTIKKEHAFLAGGIVGGCILGAGLYAAYQAIRYRGTQRVSKIQAHVAQSVFTLSEEHGWGLSSNKGYDWNMMHNFVNNFQQDATWANMSREDRKGLIRIYNSIKKNEFIPEDTVAGLIKIYDFTKQNGLILEDIFEIIQNQSTCQKDIYNHEIDYKTRHIDQKHNDVQHLLLRNHYTSLVEEYIKKDKKLNEVSVEIKPQNAFPFWVKQNGRSNPVPIHYLLSVYYADECEE
jgi:hypothetical protein